MAHIIAEPCIGVKDAACVVVCPVDDPIPAPWNFDDFRTDVLEGEKALAGRA